MKAKYCPCLSVKLFADIVTQSIHLRLSRRRGKMNIRYRVELSEAERSELGSLLRGGDQVRWAIEEYAWRFDGSRQRSFSRSSR